MFNYSKAIRKRLTLIFVPSVFSGFKKPRPWQPVNPPKKGGPPRPRRSFLSPLAPSMTLEVEDYGLNASINDSYNAGNLNAHDPDAPTD